MSTRLCLVFLMAFALATTQCKERSEQSAVNAAAVPGPKVDFVKFRNMFLGAVKATYPPERFAAEKDNLIYYPSRSLVEEPDTKSTSQFFLDLSKSISNVTPLELYRFGVQSPAEPVSDSELTKALEQVRTVNGEPMMLVIVPGIFGEFINTHAFEEVFANANSDFRKRWTALKPANVTGPSGIGPQGMDKLMVVGSLDDAQKKSILDVMLFNTPRLSLESMGAIAEQGELFSKRLAAAFKLIGRTPKNITLLGYSRGTMIALEMMAAKPEVLKNVTAMISLGGVVYGSALADELDKPESVSAQQVAAVNQLIANLEDGTNWTELNLFQKNALVLRNFSVWSKFILAMMKTTAPDVTNLELKEALAKAKGQLDDLFSVDLSSIWQLIAFFWAEFKLWDPFGEQYPNNIARFKKAAQAAITGVSELSFKSRMKWWAAHTVPTEGVRYYSITSTMSNQDPLRGNPATEVPNSPDTRQLLASYDSYIRATTSENTGNRGISINDSQVGADTARFWPKLSTMLNPNQSPLSVTYLGILGTSHWGLALEEVTRLRDGKKNPFPRVALLKALAATVALDTVEVK
jgi:pimeloyl-ACP methyl ester carboxylesterase